MNIKIKKIPDVFLTVSPFGVAVAAFAREAAS